MNAAVLGSDSGLELRWWVVHETGELGRVLAEYADLPVPIDERTREVWRANGLRLVAVPLAEIAEVRSRLVVMGAIQRQWLGQATAWVEGVRGPSYPGGMVIAMHDGPLTLEPGRLRLLVRAWMIPLPPPPEEEEGATGPRAALQLEVVPQHVPARARQALPDLIQGPQALREAADEGLVFSRLHGRMVVGGAHAYLLVAEAPEVEWSGVAAEGPEGNGADGGEIVVGADGGEVDGPPAGVAERPSAPGIGEVARRPAERGVRGTPAGGPLTPDLLAAGPPAPLVPTLGQAMLISETETMPPRRARAVILFVPRVPDRFDLIRR